MSRKILSSALLVSIVSIPFIYLLISQIGTGQLIAIIVIVYIASASSAWLSVRIAQSATQSKGSRKAPRAASRPREKSNSSSDTGAVAQGPREAGQVKWFNASKGFGFITRDTGEDIFVHFRSIQGDGHRVLKDGQRVEFSVSMGDKGLQADDVAPITR